MDTNRNILYKDKDFAEKMNSAFGGLGNIQPVPENLQGHATRMLGDKDQVKVPLDNSPLAKFARKMREKRQRKGSVE